MAIKCTTGQNKNIPWEKNLRDLGGAPALHCTKKDYIPNITQMTHAYLLDTSSLNFFLGKTHTKYVTYSNALSSLFFFIFFLTKVTRISDRVHLRGDCVMLQQISLVYLFLLHNFLYIFCVNHRKWVHIGGMKEEDKKMERSFAYHFIISGDLAANRQGK